MELSRGYNGECLSTWSLEMTRHRVLHPAAKTLKSESLSYMGSAPLTFMLSPPKPPLHSFPPVYWALCPYSSFHLKWHFHSFTSNFLIILFGGGYSCFTMFYNKANQLHAHMYPLPLELPSLPTLPAEVITEQRAELPMLCSRFSLAICFTHGSVYMSILVSQFIPLSPSPPPRPTCRFSTSASLFLPCNRFSLGIGLGIPATVIASSVPFF